MYYKLMGCNFVKLDRINNNKFINNCNLFFFFNYDSNWLQQPLPATLLAPSVANPTQSLKSRPKSSATSFTESHKSSPRVWTTLFNARSWSTILPAFWEKNLTVTARVLWTLRSKNVCKNFLFNFYFIFFFIKFLS